jgi:hypothetical protein
MMDNDRVLATVPVCDDMLSLFLKNSKYVKTTALTLASGDGAVF